MGDVARFVRFPCPRCGGTMEVEDNPDLPDGVACGNCGRAFHRAAAAVGDLTDPGAR